MKIAIIGAGALGGYVGSILSESGVDLILYDVEHASGSRGHHRPTIQHGLHYDSAKGFWFRSAVYDDVRG